MLPQFPKTQKQVTELTSEAMFDAMYQAAPLLLKMSTFQQHEGMKGTYQVDSGEIENTNLTREAVKVTAPICPGKGNTLEELIDTMAKAGADLGRKIENKFVTGVESAAEKVGNVVAIKNGVIPPEAFFEMIEKVQIDFDEKGQSQSSWFLPSETAQQLASAYESWTQNPQLKAKLDELKQRKKEEFRAREATRRLA